MKHWLALTLFSIAASVWCWYKIDMSTGWQLAGLYTAWLTTALLLTAVPLGKWLFEVK